MDDEDSLLLCKQLQVFAFCIWVSFLVLFNQGNLFFRLLWISYYTNTFHKRDYLSPVIYNIIFAITHVIINVQVCFWAFSSVHLLIPFYVNASLL